MRERERERERETAEEEILAKGRTREMEMG